MSKASRTTTRIWLPNLENRSVWVKMQNATHIRLKRDIKTRKLISAGACARWICPHQSATGFERLAF
jgi:ribosomal protein L28